MKVMDLKMWIPSITLIIIVLIVGGRVYYLYQSEKDRWKDFCISQSSDDYKDIHLGKYNEVDQIKCTNNKIYPTKSICKSVDEWGDCTKWGYTLR